MCSAALNILRLAQVLLLQIKYVICSSGSKQFDLLIYYYITENMQIYFFWLIELSN